jgi:hypothetical protein
MPIGLSEACQSPGQSGKDRDWNPVRQSQESVSRSCLHMRHHLPTVSTAPAAGSTDLVAFN